MKKAFLLLACFCLFTSTAAFAKFADNAKNANLSIPESYSASTVLIEKDEQEAEEGEVYPDRVIYATGTVQIFVPGRWYINSKAPDLKIWVWTWSSVNPKHDGHWRLVAKNEIVSQKNSIVRISIDEEEPYFVYIYYLNSDEQEVADWRGLEIRGEDVKYFIEKKIKNNELDNVKGKNFSYELVTGCENASISLRAIAHRISNFVIEDKVLYGFIVADSRGFLDEFLEFDQEKMKSDLDYQKKTLEKMNQFIIRDDQFFIAIYRQE